MFHAGPVTKDFFMIEVENLRFQYAGNKQETLKGISFSIRPGEIFGFLGPSGSGKSTTQKILYKLLNGYSGKLTINGKALSEWDSSFYEFIGVGFELPNHYTKLTAEENLQFFSSFYKKPARYKELLEKVGLAAEAKKLVTEFSKGMKMRLNFVRALMHDPDIIFLDEPTSGLDPINARVLKDLIKEQREIGKTIFLTTHSMFDADELCNQVALLYQGEIKAMDNPAKLKLAYGQRKVKVEVEGEADPINFGFENLGHNEAFLNILRGNSLKTIHSEEATLEEVFIKVTGQQLA